MRVPSPARPRLNDRRGTVAVLVGLFLTVMLGVAALAIDIPYAVLVGDQLQNGLEAAAHGAVMELDGTEEGLERATAVALAFGAINTAGGQGLALSEDHLRFGYADEGGFFESPYPEDIDTIRIERELEVQSLVAGAAFGKGVGTLRRRGTAITRDGGAAEVECFLPLALPSCLIEYYGKEGVQQVDLVLNPPGSDNVGWARPGANPNDSWVSGQVRDCKQDGTLAIGDDIGLNNGVMNNVLSAMAEAIEASDTAWDEAAWGPLPAQGPRSSVGDHAYGATLEGPVVVFQDDAYCAGGGSFTETQEVIGFAWIAIYDVATSGSVAEPALRARLEPKAKHRIGTRVGGPSWGVNGPGGVHILR